MSVVLNSGKTTATLNGTITAEVSGILTPDAAQTPINVVADGTGAGQTLRTVTTGKTFYVFGLQFTNGTAAGICNFYMTDGTTRFAVLASPANGSAQISSSVPIAKFTSAQEVKANANSGSAITLWGIEE